MNTKSIVEDSMPMIIFHAKTIFKRIPYSSYIELDDLINSGVEGLLSCMTRYNNNYDNSFRTFADLRVKGAMLDHLRSIDWKTRTIRDHTNTILDIVERILNERGTRPTTSEIAEELNVSISRCRDILSYVERASVTYFEEIGVARNSYDDEIDPFIDTLKSDCVPVDEQADKLLMYRRLAKKIDNLSDKEKQIISWFYIDNKTHNEISVTLNVTQSRVSQIMKGIHLKLRGMFETDGEAVPA